MVAKKRLDLILFEHGFFETKSAASANILAHNVKINGNMMRNNIDTVLKYLPQDAYYLHQKKVN